MSTKRIMHKAMRVLAVASLLGALCLPVGSTARANGPTPIVVIVSSKLGLTSISLAKLRRCFLGGEVTVGNRALIPFNHQPGSDTRKRFDLAVLGMDSLTSQRYWIDSMIRGGRKAPRAVPNEQLLVRLVGHLQGAVGYLEAEPKSVDRGVTVLAIDGKAPGDPGYPLR